MLIWVYSAVAPGRTETSSAYSCDTTNGSSSLVCGTMGNPWCGAFSLSGNTSPLLFRILSQADGEFTAEWSQLIPVTQKHLSAMVVQWMLIKNNNRELVQRNQASSPPKSENGTLPQLLVKIRKPAVCVRKRKGFSCSGMELVKLNYTRSWALFSFFAFGRGVLPQTSKGNVIWNN